MNWQETLRELEHNKQWDAAIEFMQEVIDKNPNDMDAYIAINYLLMNLLVEENHDESKHDYYEMLTKRYFDESYEKFSENPEYLFYTGRTAIMSEWYFGIETEDYEEMLKKALKLNPDNLMYQWYIYGPLGRENPENPLAIQYAEKVLDPTSPIQMTLQKKVRLVNIY